MNKAMLQMVLGDLSDAFRSRDVEGLLRLFSTSETVTYAGSEAGEKATGPAELRGLFSELLGRAVAYSFTFDEITFGEQNELVWLVADGDGTETAEDGTTDTFPYRLTGVLAAEDAQWRWLMLAGSEPTPGEPV